MKKLLMIFGLAFSIIACTSDDNSPHPQDPDPDPNEYLSEKGYLEYIGGIQLPNGPHSLAINGNSLFMQRDNVIYKLDIANPEQSMNLWEYSGTADLSTLYIQSNKLYTAGKSNGKLYEFDMNLNLTNSYVINVPQFKGGDVLINGSTFWISGSDNSNAMMARFTKSGSTLNVEEVWTAGYGGSYIESIDEKGNHILASTANGNLLVFDKNNISAGPTQTLTYENESGHEKWGKTIMVNGNAGYWANWGAGFATANLANMNAVNFSAIITDSAFKNQFPGSSGTSVYDIDFNSQHNTICVANGWGGLFLVKPNSPNQVLDYIKPKDLQLYSVATKGNYIYAGSISGGISGDLKGVHIFKFK